MSWCCCRTGGVDGVCGRGGGRQSFTLSNTIVAFLTVKRNRKDKGRDAYAFPFFYH